MSKIKDKIYNAKKSIEKGTNKIKNKTKHKNKFLIFLFTLGIIFASAVLVFGLYIIFTAPDFNTTRLYSKEASVIYDKNGNELARVGNENRVLVTYDDLPEVFVDALIATEDSRFFQHNGFDAARFLKASINQLMGKDAGGASTLTMQVVKNTYTGKEVSLVRKFKDIYMSIFKIEKNYTKEEIIEFYVNSQWLGNGGTNYSSINGVEQASQTYFGKSVKDLSLPEAALLVGMFNNPAYFNPKKFPENAKSRQKVVLNLMTKHGYITEEEAKNASSIPIESLLKDPKEVATTIDQGIQPFIEYVLTDVEQKTGSDPKVTPMAIYTTLDPSVQDVVTKLENGEIYTFVDDKVQNGIAITSTVDGSIVALGAGRDFVKTGTNRAVGDYGNIRGIKRQPGSTAKPIFDYGPFIEYNNGSTGTLFFDYPYTYSNGVQITNYDNRYKGMITMRDALVDSRNIPALQAFQQVDKDKIKEFVHNLGIDYGKELYEASSIGGQEGVNPLQMSAAYAAFGRGGYYIEPYSFTKIVYLENEKEYNYKYTKTRVMSEETAYMITDMLVTGGSTGVGGAIKVNGTQVAAKGGTTTIDEEDAKKLGISRSTTPDHWNNVYSPDYSISLWYGYDKLAKNSYLTSSAGSTARRKIMASVANRILKTNSTFKEPSGVVRLTIEFGSIPMRLATDNTPANLRRNELFKQGTEPTGNAAGGNTRYSMLNNPSNGKAQANGGSIIISWDPASVPEIEEEPLDTPLDKYNDWASKFYNSKVAPGGEDLGELGYEVYLQNEDDSLTSLGFTNITSFNYDVAEAGVYRFVIKTAYSNYKSNMSNGLTITVNLSSNSASDNNSNTSTPSHEQNSNVEDELE